ncbi:ADAMTS-like protein 4 [Manduca sexta]|uniref:ADAMTS-like protein 4 n=1 Tax=Manduca sexta TaxID=7130 RepID=UPI001890398B|nr:ADAMTS-like protein 4 [Manduca sexta]
MSWLTSTLVLKYLEEYFILQVVGHESVLAGNGAHEMRCGRRLVSGLFSRPRLPLGYSYVTTVPPGACRLNVSEIVASENYIALKISNSSYIMNGEFAVSAPGTYEAAGARFVYSRGAGLDVIYAHGPIHYPIDIMILYTQPNPSIKYEYFTEATGDDKSASVADLPDIPSTATTKHTRRHHNFDAHSRSLGVPRHPDLTSMSKKDSNHSLDENSGANRRFAWKILSYTQCTRSCGGGIQLGKYRCVEITNGSDREVSSVHCAGSPPAGRRRRCGNTVCPPRWRAAAWSACPRCGPASRTRIVGCVQDHARGITKISDQKCLPPKPSTTEPCDIPRCDDNYGMRHIETKRPTQREHTDTFREGPVYTVAVNTSDIDIGPEYSFNAPAGWIYTEWSECTGWCVGGGVQTRNVRCADPSGCAPRKEPEATRTCTLRLPCEPLEGQWFTSEWSRCSAKCGGKQVRSVLCIGGTGRRLRNNACKEPRPDHERDCGGECPPTWYFSDWSQCMGNCSFTVGVQRRTVVCTHEEIDGESGETDCKESPPQSHRTCELSCSNLSTLPPDLTIESQKVSGYEGTSTQINTARGVRTKDCEDKLPNCMLAVQARLCHYKYYIQNCCDSCRV